MKKIFCGGMLALLLGGCATQHPPQSREDWLKTTTRTYSGVTKDQALTAAEKLLRLADGDDFALTYTADTVQATRSWSVYLVIAAAMGTDYWTIRADQVGDAVKVAVQVNTQSQSITPMPTTTSGTWTAGTMPMSGSPVMGTAIYDVFWARMDYLLGKADEWMTCEKANKRVSDGVTWGTNESLCNAFNMKDSLPEKLAALKQGGSNEKDNP